MAESTAPTGSRGQGTAAPGPEPRTLWWLPRLDSAMITSVPRPLSARAPRVEPLFTGDLLDEDEGRTVRSVRDRSYPGDSSCLVRKIGAASVEDEALQLVVIGRSHGRIMPRSGDIPVPHDSFGAPPIRLLRLSYRGTKSGPVAGVRVARGAPIAASSSEFCGRFLVVLGSRSGADAQQSAGIRRCRSPNPEIPSRTTTTRRPTRQQ